MVKLLHGADFHLDSPFDSLPEEKAAQRRAEQRELLDKLAELANSEAVDAVLLSGDLLDSDKSYYETGEALIAAFQKMRAPVFIAPGNHDYYHTFCPWAVLKLPKNVHVFSSQTPQGLEIAGGRCVVWGAAFTASHTTGLLEGLPKIPRDGGAVHVMALHGQMGTEGLYNPVTEIEIAATGLHYLALGHQHSYSGLQRAGETFYAYSGCPEGRGFDETGEKGVVLVQADRGKVKTRLISLGGRQYHTVSVDIQDAADVTAAILAELPERAGQDIYKILLTGEFGGRLDLEGLTAAVADRFYHVVIRDNTRIRRDIWAEAEADTLRGLFLRKMRDRYEAGDSAERETVVLAIRYALAAMENGEQWLT